MTARKQAPRKQALDDWAPDHMARWLEAVTKRLRADLAAAGAFPFPELRGSHRRLLQMIPADGIRVTDLARRAAMTKQALGEFMDWLEQAGFVVSGRDPADGRVRLITRTRQGDAAAIEATRAIEAVERRWRTEIGAAQYDAMKQALRDLGHGQIG